MNKGSYLIFLGLVVCACNSSSTDKKSTTDNQPQSTRQESLEPFADSLVRLDKFAPESLNKAAGYYANFVPADSSLADSAAVLFLQHLSSVVDTVNQSLFQDTTDYSNLVYNNNPNVPEKQKAFQQRLQANHINLQGDGEGGVYAVADYDWVNSVLQPKTSGAVDQYLSLVSKEEKAPTLLDAGLAIEITDLVDRLISSEELAKRNLPGRFSEHAAQLNQFYTNTLLFGSDNSPALDYNSIALTDEFKKGYDYLLSTYPASGAAKLVSEWQEVIKSKSNKKVQEWRQKFLPNYD